MRRPHAHGSPGAGGQGPGVVVALVALVASSTLLALAAWSAPAAAARPDRTGAAPAMQGLRVVHPPRRAPYLADRAGKFVLLRGVDDNALVHYPADFAEAPPIARSDLAEMAALGFDFVRLPVSWSRIMPRPGVIDRPYLQEIARVVAWARLYGIGVLVDMHQDNYSIVTNPTQESDGAPAWAVITHGTPCTPVVTTTACALATFDSFWSDVEVAGRPLQAWYLEAAIAVAKAAGATRPTSNVVGVELMNEPWPAGPSPFERTSLYPFYRRMINGLRAAGVAVPLWFEPSIIRDVTDNALAAAARFSNDPNLVYAVHIYSGVFAPPPGPTASLKAMATSYANAAREAAVFAVPFVVDEYGSNATPAWNVWLEAQLRQQNLHRVGSGFWLWKQRRGHWYDWSVVHLNGSLRPTTLRAQLLGEPHVDAVPGDLIATSAGAERLTATIKGPGGKALLWGGTVVAAGGPKVTAQTLHRVTVDGHLVPAVCHRVRFAGAGVRLTGCLLIVHVPAGRRTITATP